MIAKLTSDGILIVQAESEIDAYALGQWSIEKEDLPKDLIVISSTPSLDETAPDNDAKGKRIRRAIGLLRDERLRVATAEGAGYFQRFLDNMIDVLEGRET